MIVEPEREIHAISRAIGDHRRRPFEHLLRRLEDQPHGPGELRREILSTAATHPTASRGCRGHRQCI